MAQEQAGRILRGATHRAKLVGGILASRPADPGKRTGAEWDAVRAAVPDGRFLPSSVIKARTRQITAFIDKHGRLPEDVFELEGVPNAARLLSLAAADAQQATLRRVEDEGGRALLRVQLPTRPDPRSYADWTWVACPLALPPTVPAGAVLHLPTLRPQGARVRADLAFTHAVPAIQSKGRTTALGVDWGVNTLLSAGACKLHEDGAVAGLGAGGMFRAAGVLGKQHRLRRQSERLQARLDQHQRLDPRLGDDTGGYRDACDTGDGQAAANGGGRTTETGHLAARYTRLTAAERRLSARRTHLRATVIRGRGGGSPPVA
ncbi:hypothetical protein ACQPZP_35530 [Spirillospora sp. CA-142024]|uniref:hypothetical protein n=1 Tax=Spirillospora sp. CA-142024 TaxID=3240036 RepID=UPI003D92E391